MRIATFNVLHGRLLHDDARQARPDGRDGQQGSPLADAVAALDADVLALQELDRFQERSGEVDQASVAATAMSATDWRYASAFHGRAIPDVGWVRDHSAPELTVCGPEDAETQNTLPSHGTALLTRLPVRLWRVRRFAGAPGGMPLRVVGRKGLLPVRDHARVAIAAVLESPRGPLTVVATHLSFVPGWNVWQLASLTRWIADLPRPHLLLGDLNLVGPVPRAVLAGGELFAGLTNGTRPEHHWHDLARTATYPANHPRVQFDRILASGIPRSAVRAVHAPQASISDHRPLIVELDD
ncbi:endonuclease/exonuclease/phosphatase family protein [Actinospica sp.]|jgi:endonuclease/exonuclease/phosphatase family metal-dependent hydrolase|uniref:endonuclease/exonuclease/phosphatase family protein n=1 Tax=Actinospica sp. TaxID=1872142 RepID=UPI002BB572A9|nr:endonuclease/exonuclease/phosphatase family protein [Actinospica sp.]HWG23901.1 endonuclease/exonuclease/phosphatase family protein [Actinospica sp.]